jgi:hypothetical protein
MAPMTARSGWPTGPVRRACALAAAGLATALLAALASPSVARRADPPVRLTVVFTREDGAPRRVARLRCAGDDARAAGYLHDLGAARACRLARGRAGLLASSPDSQRACTQVYGGPERARVSGRIGEHAIARSFARSDGCRIDEWARAMPLLPGPRRGAVGP